MNIKLIGCDSCKNEVNYLGTQANTHCQFLDYSFHADPRKLHDKLQEIINESQDYDLIILTYSRCSNSVLGLISRRVPMLLPSTHDCIGLMLGSTENQLNLTKNNLGTYFFSQGWLDYGRNPYDEYLQYVEKYGQEDARSLIDSLYGRYNRAVFIKTPGINNLDKYRKKLGLIANFFGWEVEEVDGNVSLLNSILKGSKETGSIYLEPGEELTKEHFNKKL